MTTTLRILKKATCPKLSTRAKGTLTYHVGYAANDKSFHIRITANAGGFFSNEYINLGDVLTTMVTNGSDSAFKALVFKPLYQSKGANNHGFLAAALLTEGILQPEEGKALSFVLRDAPAFKAAMNKLIKEKVDLENDVAIAESAREAKRSELTKKMQAAAKARKDAKEK
jgi:hypothetical protein